MMKILTVLGILALAGSQLSLADPEIRCGGIEYSRIDVTHKSSTAGDSNGSFNLTLKLDKNEQWVARDAYRFQVDQSADPSPGLFGIELIATYSEGNGTQLVFLVRQYKSNAADAAFEVIANWVLDQDSDKLRFEASGIMGAKVVSLGLENGLAGIDVPGAIKSGRLAQNDLFYVNVGFCKLSL
jgi:hypothetical protein